MPEKTPHKILPWFAFFAAEWRADRDDFRELEIEGAAIRVLSTLWQKKHSYHKMRRSTAWFRDFFHLQTDDETRALLRRLNLLDAIQISSSRGAHTVQSDYLRRVRDRREQDAKRQKAARGKK